MYYSLQGIGFTIGECYNGNMVVGDREATIKEVSLYEADRLELIKPKIVTKLQMMEAMLETDVTTTSNMWLNFKALRASNELLNDYWLSTLDVNRNHPMTIDMKALMNKTDADLDDIFLLANSK